MRGCATPCKRAVARVLRPGTDNFVFQGQRGDLVEIESVKHHFLSPRKRETMSCVCSVIAMQTKPGERNKDNKLSLEKGSSFFIQSEKKNISPTHFPQLMRTQFPRRRLEQLDVNVQAFVPEFQSLLSRVLWGYHAKRSVQSQF